MSEFFTGATFANQKVAPSDDAIIRRSILPDGILTGCGISYSGSTLTMASGQLMVCGRQIRHPSAQNWAVVDATSGFARLVLTIDLTRTASKETFDQVTTAIEYASAEDGFVELEQSDINVSGTRYQVAVCVVSLGTGGITGIVSQLEKSAVDGSGALNFKVVGGVTQPSGPAENTIWVSTDVKITSWIFAFEEPAEPAEGMVWFSLGTSCPVGFNALKKNGIEVYPIFASQYVGGAWQTVTAMIYQSGKWAEFVTLIYDSGAFYYTYSEKLNDGSAAYNADNIQLTTKSASTAAYAFIEVGPVSLDNISTLKMKGYFSDALTKHKPVLSINTAAGQETSKAVASAGNVIDGTITGQEVSVELDVTEFTGDYYISGGHNTNGEVWSGNRNYHITSIVGF